MGANLPFRVVAASEFANDVDRLFYVLLALTFFFSIVVGGLLTYLAVRFRRGSNVDRSRPISHHNLLEAAWSGGPLILALIIFFWAAKLFAGVYACPPNAKEIFVIGKQWMWHLQHEEGIRENNELHLEVSEPVKLTMISQDVIHAFYVPEFRVQRQVEPGSYDAMWFHADRHGAFSYVLQHVLRDAALRDGRLGLRDESCRLCQVAGVGRSASGRDRRPWMRRAAT